MPIYRKTINGACAAASLSLLALAAVATSASAECAWVLWHRWDMSQLKGPNGEPNYETNWVRHSAYDSNWGCNAVAPCLAAVTYSQSKQHSKDVAELERRPTGVYQRWKNGNTLTDSYECWPDTVDPCAP